MSKASDAALRHHAARRVQAFHDAFEVKAGTHASVAPLRITLHEEEHDELEEALEAVRDGDPQGREKVARELADELVHLYGTADLLDIDLDAAFDAVMDSNMAKLPECAFCNGKGDQGKVLVVRGKQSRLPCEACGGTGKGPPIKRPSDQKVMKPDGWQPPDLSPALEGTR